MSPITCVLPVVTVPRVCCPKEGGLRDQLVMVLTARLENSKILGALEDYLSHLGEPAQSDVCSLIREHVQLFGDKPTQTTVFQHDFDIGDHKQIKKHAYRVNPTKRAVMTKEVEYFLQSGFALSVELSLSFGAEI